jgi:hypothetical protein
MGKEMNGLEQETPHRLTGNRLPWLRKVGWIGFALFLIKGIVWLIVGYFLLR